MLIGTYQPDNPGSTGEITAFGKAIGFTPRITSYYSTFSQPFAVSFARAMAAQGTQVLVQWQPRGASNEAIAAGEFDSYIQAFAQAVASVNAQVIISYGQEMNGNWYQWGTSGQGNSTPAAYIAAYRHVWSLFEQAGVHNVTWLWDPNVDYSSATPLASVYPGDQYVDWVGLDGYYSTPQTTFSGLFGPSIATFRTFTHKPLVIGESGVSGASAGSQLTGLFAGADLAGAVALVYFDQAQSGDPMHQDWRVEDNPPALAAFRAAVLQYGERPLLITPAAP
jgi:mannan endo-1,4-beta-mannosidase